MTPGPDREPRRAPEDTRRVLHRAPQGLLAAGHRVSASGGLLCLVWVTIALAAAPLNAEASPAGGPELLLPLLGTEVEIEGIDGARLRGRLLSVLPCVVILQRPGGATRRLPMATVRRLRRVSDEGGAGGRGPTGGWIDPDPPLLPCADEPGSTPEDPHGSPRKGEHRTGACPSPTLRREFRMEWVGLRLASGLSRAFSIWEGSVSGWKSHFAFELTLFSVRYRELYVEGLRVGYGVLGPFWGAGIGYAATLDAAGRHELRIGLHLTLWWGFLPNLSGLQITYVMRTSRWFAFEIGVQQTSFPFSVSLTAGFRI